MKNAKGLGLILIIELCLLAIILVFKYLITDTWAIMEVRTIALILLAIVLLSKFIALVMEKWDSAIIYVFINLMISLIFLLSLWFAEYSTLLLGIGASALTIISLMIVASDNAQSSKEHKEKVIIVEDLEDEENKILKNLEELHALKKKEAKLEAKEKNLESDVKELKDQVANIKPISAKTTRKKKEKILVFVSKNGKRYHNKDCILAAKIPKQMRLVYNSEKEALKKGYSPCRVCTPGK